MAFQQCVLNGFQYPYNPPKNSKNPAVRAVTRAATLTGQVVTDWGVIAQDRVIEQAWDVMDPAMYGALQAMYLAGGSYAFTDEWGGAYTVVVGSLTNEGVLKGGQAYESVKMLLWPQ